MLPLSRGSVQPVDSRAYKGLRLELRGSGPYIVRLITLHGSFAARVEGGNQWREIDLPFTSFHAESKTTSEVVQWRGDDLLQISFELTRPAGAQSWAELDNMLFY